MQSVRPSRWGPHSMLCVRTRGAPPLMAIDVDLKLYHGNAPPTNGLYGYISRTMLWLSLLVASFTLAPFVSHQRLMNCPTKYGQSAWAKLHVVGASVPEMKVRRQCSLVLVSAGFRRVLPCLGGGPARLIMVPLYCFATILALEVDQLFGGSLLILVMPEAIFVLRLMDYFSPCSNIGVMATIGLRTDSLHEDPWQCSGLVIGAPTPLVRL